MAWGRSNNVATTLQNPMLIGATTAVVVSATDLPSTPFPLTIAGVASGVLTTVPEIVLCTNVSGTTLTVSRGQEGTSAVAHSAGEVVAQTITATSLANLPYLAQGGLAVSANVLDTAGAGTLSLGTAVAIAITVAAIGVVTSILGGITTPSVDSGASLSLGTTNATSVAVGKSGITTTVTGGLTQLTGAVSLTGNGASSFTTSAGGLTLTAAAASTWSTSAGALTLTSAAAATWKTAAGALTVDSAAALNLGTSAATSISVGKSGITTTITGGLTQLTGAVSLTGNGASTFTTSSGALTLTAGGASTWSTSSGALVVSSAAELDLNAATGSVVGIQNNAATAFSFSSSTLSLTQAGTQYTISQVAAASGAGSNLIITPQAATTTGANGSLQLNISAPASGTVEAGYVLSRGGTTIVSIQSLVGAATNGAIYLATAAATPSATNYSMQSNGTTTAINGSSGVNIDVASSAYLQCTASTILLSHPLQGLSSGTPFAFGSTTAISLAGGGTISLTNAQLGTPALSFTGTLPNDTTIAIGGKIGFFVFDVSGVTLSAHALIITNGAGTFTATTLYATKTLLVVNCFTAATLAVG
jgi:hypothetical protein